jgi:tetratricopeptide (TPR) repeat protein
MTGFYDDIEEMLESDDTGVVAQGEAMLRARDQANPDDALVQYFIASAFDSAGHEADAMDHYRRAIALGVEQLPAEYQPQLYVQAGSTLRNLQRFDEARQLLEDGIARFPDYLALQAFLALVEVSSGDDRAAVNRLFAIVLADAPGDESLRRYRRSLTWYAQEIAERVADANHG